jgi:hypothetical protein
VHDDGAVLMKTRWALSFLRGPLTGPEIARLMAPRRNAAPSASAAPASAAPGAALASGAARPAVGAGIPEYFLQTSGGTGPVLYKPMLAGFAKLHYVDAKLGLDEWQTAGWLAPFADGSGDAAWEDAAMDAALKSRLARSPAEDAGFAELPASALRAANLPLWGKSLQAHLYETARARVFYADALKAASRAGESEGDFRARLALAARERRDAAVATLRTRWQAKITQLGDHIRRAEEKRERERGQLSQQKLQTAVSIGSSILGALLGRKAISATNLGRVGTAARSAARIGREADEVARAEESIEVLEQRLADAQREVEGEVAKIDAALDPAAITLRGLEVPARKADIAIGEVALVWAPWRTGSDGFPAPAFD